MKRSISHQDREPPQNLIGGLVRQLRKHALWDSLLIFGPPLMLIVYLLAFLYRASWIPRSALLGLAGAAVVIGILAVALRYRPRIPAVRTAARLLDEKASSQDRFVTLATLDPSSRSGSFFERLQREAAGMVRRVQIERDFPYSFKRSFLRSVLISLVAAGLFHALLPLAQSSLPAVPAETRIRELVRQLEQQPRLSELARSLAALTKRLEDPKVPAQEKQKLIQEMQQKLVEQLKQEKQQDNRDLLAQAAGSLKGLEQESGGEQRKEQQKGGGGVNSNLPQENQGEGKKQSQDGGGDGQGDRTAQLTKEMRQGKSTQGDPKKQDQEKAPQNRGEGKGNEPDPNLLDANKPGGKKDDRTGGKAQGGSAEKVGRSKRSEEIPQGAPPAERYFQPGEQGREGLKGARYVTVQLPEEVAADSKGEISGTKESKERKSRPKVPVSNVPLPSHIPDAPTEKQPMPLEYRDIIR